MVLACAAPGFCNRLVGDTTHRGLNPDTDLTFFVCGDTHLGHVGEGNKHETQIAAMNALPGKAYPASFLGETVAVPRGVWIVGDLTDNGLLTQWNRFVSLYGLTGSDGMLHSPVFEGYGNHDIRYNRTFVKDGIKARHGTLHYSLNWEGIHIANCNIYPGATTTASQSLSWLINDLAVNVGRSGRPVIIMMHYDFLPPISEVIYWTDAERATFKRAIAGYNILGIFHGHWHNTFHYKWEGYDIYNVGATRSDQSESFAVVHITDDIMEVANYRWVPGDLTGNLAQWEGWAHSKPILLPVRTAVPSHAWTLYE